jgi:hypothetical protein
MHRSLATLVILGALLSCSNGPTAPSPGPSTLPIPTGAGREAAEMFRRLDEFIEQSIAYNRELLPLNPSSAAQINQKIAMLERPGLALEVSTARRFAELEITSTSGRPVFAAAVFPIEEMRRDAEGAIDRVGRALPLLERFIRRPFPFDFVRIWYGFRLGSRGGGGSIEAEDRATYAARSAAVVPHAAIIDHELAHSYIGNEALAQWLELYVYNIIETRSADVADWAHTRGYAPSAPGNSNVAALLDVYRLIGEEAMSDAFSVLQPLGARYGEPLPAAVQLAFVDRAPTDVQARVRDLVARVTF